ncbi:hypothetical protein T484DRAFT_3497553 [Baffinella frigidus]|nr:hypothetical protein T484DRAFT_3497553 [Cryptophyta sp. CCMP2293]
MMLPSSRLSLPLARAFPRCASSSTNVAITPLLYSRPMIRTCVLPLQFPLLLSWDGLLPSRGLQGYLAHKRPPPPLGPP